MRTPLALAAALAAALLAPAQAYHCSTWSTGDPQMDTNPEGIEPAPRFYGHLEFAEGYCEVACFVLFQESNGIPGLQGEAGGFSNTCHGMIQPDRRLVDVSP